MSKMGPIVKADETHLRLLMDALDNYAIFGVDTDGVIISWNAAARQMTGFLDHEVIGKGFAALFSDQHRDPDTPARALREARQFGKFTDADWRYREDGSRIWVHVTIDLITDDDGEFAGYAVVVRDRSSQKQDQDRLAALAHNLDATVTNMTQGIILYDRDEHMVLSNGRVEQMFGIAPGVCKPGTSFIDVIRLGTEQRTSIAPTDENINSIYRHHMSLLEQPDGGSVEVRFTTGELISICYRPLADGGFVAVYEDITERRRYEAHLSYMAMHDSLTRLPNRASFNDKLDAQLARAKRKERGVAVITIDLDRFKDINDSHGHAVGDEVLRRLAKRMAQAVREGELVGRFGGDEFAVSKVIDGREELDDLLERVENSLLQPLELSPYTLSPGASLGVAIYPQDGTTREQLLNNADLAMYRAKATIARNICFYEPRMDESARFRRALTGDISRALEEGEFALAYQVQKALSSDKIVGHEALIRWNHPKLGIISPDIFIPVAEESGAIMAIGEWVLRTACSAAASGALPEKVAVNLSPVQMAHGNLVELVREVLADTGLSPSRLELEITESTIISDKVHGLHVLRQIKALGVSVALDDFGTGFSSLDTLHSFPIDKIKIDRSFLTDDSGDKAGWAIIRAILALGRNLGIPVLAEGIETEEQLTLLRLEGCHEGQGYFLGRPEIPESTEPASQQLHYVAGV